MMLLVITLVLILLVSLFGGYFMQPKNMHPTVSQNENTLTVCVYIPCGSIILFKGWHDEEISIFSKNSQGEWVFQRRVRKEKYYSLLWGKEPKIVAEHIEKAT